MTAKCAVFDENGSLTPKQFAAIDALLAAGNVTDVAAQIGVSRRTLHAWLKQPPFQSAYRAARRRLVEAAVTTLQRHVDDAAQTLLAVMLDTTVAPAVRVSAASKVLEMAFRAVEIDDIGARLDLLEAAQGEGRA